MRASELKRLEKANSTEVYHILLEKIADMEEILVHIDEFCTIDADIPFQRLCAYLKLIKAETQLCLRTTQDTNLKRAAKKKVKVKP